MRFLITVFMFSSLLFSIDFNNSPVSLDCSRVVDKNYYSICYKDKYRAPLAVLYRLYGDKVHSKNIENRLRFYEEPEIPLRVRSKYRDYTKSGFDRGHLASDASFDWSIDSLKSTYSMANIVPMLPAVNRKAWLKAEKLERRLAVQYGSVDVLNVVKFSDRPKFIGRGRVAIPSGFYKYIYRDDILIEKIFVSQGGH